MNDTFLNNLREPPRQEFADALYQRINQPMKTTSFSIRPFAWVAAAAVLALLLTLLISPAARAAAQSLIFQIGHLLITGESTYAEQFEAKINSTEPAPAALKTSPAPVEWQAPALLSLEEAEAQAGFPAAEIGSLPPGYTPLARSVSQPDDQSPYTRINTTFQSAGGVLVFSQMAYQPGAESQTLPAGAARVETIVVQGVKGAWLENLRLSTYVDDNNQVAPQFANALAWEKDGFAYWLQSTPGLTQDDMLAIANSVK